MASGCWHFGGKYCRQNVGCGIGVRYFYEENYGLMILMAASQ
tara:strand:+ start:301 stop:426 length:126 start_codon:yes stop_codon:yes gene_type:complete